MDGSFGSTRPIVFRVPQDSKSTSFTYEIYEDYFLQILEPILRLLFTISFMSMPQLFQAREQYQTLLESIAHLGLAISIRVPKATH